MMTKTCQNWRRKDKRMMLRNNGELELGMLRNNVFALEMLLNNDVVELEMLRNNDGIMVWSSLKMLQNNVLSVYATTNKGMDAKRDGCK